MNILISNATVVTVDKQMTVIKDGFIGIQDGYIAFVTQRDDFALNLFKPDKIIDAKNKIVIPGLVNMHTHIPMTILRNYSDDVDLNEWLFNRIIPIENKFEPEDIYWGAYLGLVELIKSGVTAFADMYIQTDAMLEAIQQSKIRANFSGLPKKRVGCNFTVDSKELADHVNKWNADKDGLIKESLSIHSIYTHTEEDIKRIAALAKELNAGIHIHVSEDYEEEMKIREKYGKTTVQVLNDWGVFDVNAITAHSVHITEQDMDIMFEKGVNPVHCPSSNLKLNNGFAPVPAMLKKGVNICIGTDGPASNNNMNLIEEMHIASLIHKCVANDPTLVKAEEIVRMATTHGAKALGLEGKVGSIEKGMNADLTIINADVPNLTPLNNVHSALAYSVQESDVETVIVNGEIVMENREILTLDEERAKYEVNRIAKKLLG
ncbi:MAG: amidohydrolase [Oscillospiraceae bacterium]